MYGRDAVFTIITFGTMAAKAVMPRRGPHPGPPVRFCRSYL
ncbi:hypothetical protein ACNKHS_01205 [Shigella flexneri]